MADVFGPYRVMVILRGMASAEQAAIAAHAAWDVGVELVEIPIGDVALAPILATVVKEGRKRDKIVGAGTVISLEHLAVAISAGARYTVAPGFDSAVMNASLASGLPHLPGVATPTEVQHARAAGCRWVKVFPASTLGPDWFRAIREPFPDVSYLATGGVSIASAGDYLDAGAGAVAFGAGAIAPERRGELARFVRERGVSPMSPVSLNGR